VANGWVEEYQRFSATLAVGEASRRRLFFERQVADARENLARAEEEMKQTEQRTGVIELDGQAHAMIASAAMLRAQVAAKQVEIQAMRQFAADGNPDLERAQQELSAWKGSWPPWTWPKIAAAATWWRPRAWWPRRVLIMRAPCAR